MEIDPLNPPGSESDAPETAGARAHRLTTRVGNNDAQRATFKGRCTV